LDATIGAMTRPSDVLVVDDEPTITDIVCRYLERAGYAARPAYDGPEALAAVAARRPDLIVLDIMLPGIDGLDVMQRVRADGGGSIGVILLTAKGEQHDRIAGLRRGADDYVAKPFSPAELVARVDAVLRRTQPRGDDEPPLVSGELSIDPAARRVHHRGREVQLTQREFDLLLHFARHPGRAFTREQLMDAVWRFPHYTDTATVTVHVRRLRAKLEEDPAAPRWLQTVWGVGYRFQP
jgi:two-component system, OmpR family, response regulator ResD